MTKSAPTQWNYLHFMLILCKPCLIGHKSVPRITMPAPAPQQVPRFTTMLRSFAASGSTAEHGSAIQHAQRRALLRRKRAQAASAEVTALQLGIGRVPHALVSP